MKRLSLILALLAAPAFAQSNPIGGAGGAGLVSSYTTPGNAYYGRPLPRTMSGWWNPYLGGTSGLKCAGASVCAMPIADVNPLNKMTPEARRKHLRGLSLMGRQWNNSTGYEDIQTDYD